MESRSNVVPGDTAPSRPVPIADTALDPVEAAALRAFLELLDRWERELDDGDRDHN